MYFRKSREELIDILESLRNENGSLHDKWIKSEADRKRLKSELENRNESLVRLRDRHEKAKQENARLNERCGRLEREVRELEGRLADREEHSGMEFALFKSFVEDASQRILLIDTAYAIQYANAAALEAIGLNDSRTILEQRIFDFLPYKDALRLKEKIDRTFLKGDKLKVRDIRFQTPDENISVKLKFKIYRVRYQDKPSIKLELK